jgi:NADH-quinone oxidoreductase subunit C
MGPQGLIEAIEAKFPGETAEASFDGDDVALLVRPGALVAVAGFLMGPPHSYRMLLDLTCVDFRASAGGFEMVYHLNCLERPSRVRLKVRLGADGPAIDSLTGLWKNADWLEREVFDMFGVVFNGHPNLKRILMYEGFEGFPLRKDYPLRRRQPPAGKGRGA